MVSRSEVAQPLRDFLDLEENVDDKLRKLVEAVAESMEGQEARLMAKLEATQKELEEVRTSGKTKSEETRKDRQRTEPKEAFNGKNHVDWEWRFNNHMETSFGTEGRRLMSWIRERAQGDTKITKEEGENEFGDWKEMDKEIWTQIIKAEGDEVTNIIQGATAGGVVGSEAWRALKARYDPETAITLEAWRSESK